jgi:hypothetical protein
VDAESQSLVAFLNGLDVFAVVFQQFLVERTKYVMSLGNMAGGPTRRLAPRTLGHQNDL